MSNIIKMMMDQAHFGEYLLRQQMLHAASLSGLQHRVGPDAEPPACEARLLNGDLWRRRMFPSLRISLSGLDPREEYCVLLELSLVGRRRWRWAGGAWAAAGGAEPQSPRRLMLHPDSPAPGHHWTANPNDRITKLKIDNNPFAKGFRACGQSKCKRKSVEGDTSSVETPETSEPKRACSDAASSCSEEGSLRSSSPRSPPLVESPAPIIRQTTPENISHPAFYPPELPYMHPLHMPMPLGIWPGSSAPFLTAPWNPALAPPTPRIPSPPPPAVPCRRVKSFTISALLGEG
ncbi:unnamed protein product [Leptidea sinapis]|uniref:T-box domain-containing protein n=1 Tax=Leptidea sinapis TaxID=189913 RepID=A0A5E4R3A0_9NEOP|nr:unnamed protein product [Leptidea sinapis]